MKLCCYMKPRRLLGSGEQATVLGGRLCSEPSVLGEASYLIGAEVEAMAVSLALGRRQFRVGAQLLFRFLVLWRLLLDHPAHEDCGSDFSHLLREYAECLEDGVV